MAIPKTVLLNLWNFNGRDHLPQFLRGIYKTRHEKTCLKHVRTTKTQISLRIRCPSVAVSEIPSHLVASEGEQASLSLTWSQISEDMSFIMCRTKTVEVINTLMLTEFRNHRITDMLKTVYTPPPAPSKTTFCGGIIKRIHYRSVILGQAYCSVVSARPILKLSYKTAFKIYTFTLDCSWMTVALCMVVFITIRDSLTQPSQSSWLAKPNDLRISKHIEAEHVTKSSSTYRTAGNPKRSVL